MNSDILHSVAHRRTGKLKLIGFRKVNSPHGFVISRNSLDRFIADRSTMNIELSRYLLSLGHISKAQLRQAMCHSPSQLSYQNALFGTLFDTEYTCTNLLPMETQAELQLPLINGNELPKVTARVLPFHKNPIPSANRFKNKLSVLYSTDYYPGGVNPNTRFIKTRPVATLDAPGVIDDFYFSPLDWSSSNIIALALVDQVYLWNAKNREVTKVRQSKLSCSWLFLRVYHSSLWSWSLMN